MRALSLLVALPLSALAAERAPVLRVYGPGGVIAPLQECGRLFTQQKGVAVRVDGGPEQRWHELAEKEGDLVFAGAEHAMTDFIRRHPGLLDPATRTSLHERPAAILVRKGNPRGIRGLEDLARPGMKLLDVAGADQTALWEDLAGRKGLLPALQRNMSATFTNSAEAVAAWKEDRTLDAWITFASWHHRLPEETDLVRLPPADEITRGTSIAVVTRSERRELALAFVAFARTEPCHEVFRRQGWK